MSANKEATMSAFKPHTETNVVKITLRGVPDRPGMAAGIFSTLGEAGINVELITASAIGGGRSDVAFVIKQVDIESAFDRVRELQMELSATGVDQDPNVAIVAMHVAELVQTPGTAGRMFAALSGSGINIDMISTSMASITCLIAENRVEDAVNVLEEEFGKS
jgi:aspartate kinase